MESNDSAIAKRASRIVIEHFIPFIQAYVTSNFTPFLRKNVSVTSESDFNEPMKFKIDCAAYVEVIPPKESESAASIKESEA